MILFLRHSRLILHFDPFHLILSKICIRDILILWEFQTLEGFTIKGFKLVEGINGLFVGFPSQKGNDDEYRDTVWADRELKDALSQLAIKEYGQEVMSPPVGLEDVSPPPSIPLDTEERPVVAEPFSDDDIPF